MPSPRGHKMPEILANEADRTPVSRASYPVIVPVAVGCIVVTCLLIIGSAYEPLKRYLVYAVAIAIGGVIYWWRDTLRTLRARIPPPGWKSEVQPETLVGLTPEEFDALRFVQAGKNDENLELHEVPWVTRYSRAILYEARALWVLAGFGVMGALLWPHITLPTSGGHLPQQVSVAWLWFLAALFCLVVSWQRYSEWRYGRLMVDQSFFYDIKVYPAWLPWVRGRYELHLLKFVYRADAEDVRFGRSWNDGTLVIDLMEGPFKLKSKRFKRVPRHLDFSLVINGLLP